MIIVIFGAPNNKFSNEKNSPPRVSLLRLHVRPCGAALSAIFAERAIASGVPLSAADVQGHLMRHRGDPQSAADNFDEMIRRARRKTQQVQEEDQEGKLEASS